jgi:hypothetical protein
LHCFRFKPAGSLRGMPRKLSLMVFLDTTRNAVAIKEAYNRTLIRKGITTSQFDIACFQGTTECSSLHSYALHRVLKAACASLLCCL